MARPYSHCKTAGPRKKKNRQQVIFLSPNTQGTSRMIANGFSIITYMRKHVLMGDSAAPNHGWGPLNVIQAIVRWGTPFNRIPSHMFRMSIFFETRDSEHTCWAKKSLINHNSKSQIIPQVFPLVCNQLHG